MISVPVPAMTGFGLSAVRTARDAAAGKTTAGTIFFMGLFRALREYQIDLPPVFLRGCALRRPVRRVIELIRHLRRPVAADVAVEQVAFDRLAQTGGATGAIGFPPW